MPFISRVLKISIATGSVVYNNTRKYYKMFSTYKILTKKEFILQSRGKEREWITATNGSELNRRKTNWFFKSRAVTRATVQYLYRMSEKSVRRGFRVRFPYLYYFDYDIIMESKLFVVFAFNFFFFLTRKHRGLVQSPEFTYDLLAPPLTRSRAPRSRRASVSVRFRIDTIGRRRRQ